MAKNNIGRRDFIRFAGITGGIAGAHLAGLRQLGAAEIQAALAAQDVWIPTCCNMCGGTTGVLAHVVNGRVVKLEPSSHNPIGVANISTDFQTLKATGARMCPKGNASIMSLYDPDRVKKPLKRVGARGSGQWQEISYDQAVTEIAAKLANIKSTSGPEKLVWFTEDNNFGAIQQSLCNVYGTPNFLQHSNICDAARNIGFTLALGHGRPLPDLRNTRYMLLFGVNPLGAMKWAHLPRILLDGLANGAKIVVVDPRCSETAEKAFDFPGLWLPIRPGTDGALALAMANVIIAERLYDANFIANWTVGFDQFAALVRNRTPDWAARITGISADRIKQVAREVATIKPAVIDVWVGTAQHTNGTEAVRAIAMLAGLTGQIDAPGTGVLPERPSAKYRVPAPSAPLPPRVDGKGTKYPFAHGSGVYIEAREAMITGQPYRPKAAVFVFQNFVLSMPNLAKTSQALNNLELIVAVDTHLSETALMADYVIPGSNYLERYELLPQWVDFPVLTLRQPAVAPVYGQRLEYEFVQDLALKMGHNIYPFNAPYEQFLDDALLAGIGIGLAGLKALPGAVFIGGDTRYFKYRTSGFGTPSKKFEFYSQQMKDKGLNPLPDYVRAQDGPSSTYPFYIVNWKEALHTHSRTMNNRWLMDFHGENELWINADRASALGINDGDLVTVENQYGRAKAKAHVTSRIRPDVVGLTHGFGHWGLGPVAKGKGTNDNLFVPGKADHISGMAALKDGAVRVYK
ncbi:MAG: molybdopterin-dependent oxidoreductase [Acidobacteriota bacterium]